MVIQLLNEYLLKSEEANSVDYSDRASVRRFNALSNRMRSIVDEVVGLGKDAVVEFASVLDCEPAAVWAAHHLVEKADLDPATLSRCFTRVERARIEAEAKGDMANAMGEKMWLKEWRARKGM